MHRWFRIPGFAKHGNSGSAGVEFALIAPAFFLIFFASLETGMTYFADLTLENGVASAARLIRTGQVANGSMSQAAFRQALCDQVSMLMSCAADKLYVDVHAFSSFGSSSYQTALDANKNLNPNLNGYQTGASGTAGSNNIVLIRAFYKWPLYSPVFSTYYSNMAGNVRLISASAAFKNEPF